MKIHELKIESRYFGELSRGVKKAEIRKNDRDYNVGDILLLKEIEERNNYGKKETEKVYSGFYGIARISSILTDKQFEGLAEGYVLLNLDFFDKSRVLGSMLDEKIVGEIIDNKK